MCIIALAYKRKLTNDEIDECWKSNSQGGGIAWYDEDNKTRFIKGITTLEDFAHIIEKTPFPYCAHFRIRSSGSENVMFTHPFVVENNSPIMMEGEGKKLLFHNGTISDWRGMYLTLKLSGIKFEHEMMDTRLAACVSAIDEEFLNEFSNFNKFVIFDNDRRVITINMQYEEDGAKFSNGGYKKFVTYTPPDRYEDIYTKKWWEKPESTIHTKRENENEFPNYLIDE